MALPIKEKTAETVSFEQLLMGRVVRAFDAMDVGDGVLFDEVIEGLEMLLKLKPALYNELMIFKSQLIQQTQQVMHQVEALASNARNQIQRRVFYEGEASSVEWDARKDYFDKIIEIMGNNQMIPMQIQEPATIESAIVEEPVQEEPEQEISQNIPEKTEQRKKPKLTFQKPGKRFDV